MLHYVDSFDHFTTASQKYPLSGVAVPSIDATAGRFGTNGMYCGDSGRGAGRILPTALSDIIMGFAYECGIGNDQRVISFLDGGSEQFDLRMNTSEQLYVTRNGTTLGTCSLSMIAGRPYYVEWRVVIHDTTGEVEVRIDGVQELNLSGVDTRNAGTTVDRFYLQGRGGGDFQSAAFDDLYICDSSGGVNDDFLGDVRVQYLAPNGNGNSSQFVGSDGNSVDNYLLVDEAVPDEDTTYVESPTPTEKDTYAHTNLTPTTGTVFGLQIGLRAKKTDSGARTLASVARHSGSEVDSADHTLTTDYDYYFDVRETKPGGGSWSISDVNGAEFGQKVTS